MYALSVSAEGDCYLYVPPDLGLEAVALGASESALPGTVPAKALHTFTLDSGASALRLHHPHSSLCTCPGQTGRPVQGPSPCQFLHCSPVSGGSVSLTVRSSPPLILYEIGEYRCPPGCDGHHHHSWGSTCVDLHVYTDGPSPGHIHSSTWVESVDNGHRASSGTCVCPGVCVRSGSTPLLVLPPIAPDSPVAPPPWSPLPAWPLWYALPPPCLWSSSFRSLPPLPPSPALPCLPCVEGRQRAAPHSSSFPPASAPLKGEVPDGGAEPRGIASSGGPAGTSPRLSPRPEPLSLQQLRERFAQRTRLRSGAAGVGVSAAGDTRAGGVGVTAGAGGTGGAAAAGPGGARTRGTEAAGSGGVGDAGAGGAGSGVPAEPGGAGGGGTGASDAGAVGTGVGGTGAGGAGAGGAVSCGTGAGGTCPPPDLSKPPLQPASPLPAPSPYTEQIGGPTECREPESCPTSPVRAVQTGRRVPRSRPPPCPSFESTAASALVAELVDFAAACRLDYATALVAESAESESAGPPSFGVRRKAHESL
ncbi:unnamed protein product [Closterium sp. NIES-54]